MSLSAGKGLSLSALRTSIRVQQRRCDAAAHVSQQPLVRAVAGPTVWNTLTFDVPNRQQTYRAEPAR